MINLINTSSKIQVITGSAVNVDVSASWLDHTTLAVTPGGLLTKISTAATTDVVSAPAASTVRNVKSLYITNIHAASSVVVTVQHTDGTNVALLWTGTLLAKEQLSFTDVGGFLKNSANGLPMSVSVI